MITIFEMLQKAQGYLEERGVAKPRRAAEEVIADALGWKRLDLYLYFEKPLSEEELPRVRHALKRRAHHEPPAYIRGWVDFAGIMVRVDRQVLIPRFETEILVETVAEKMRGMDLQGKIFWDLCCGSGCIGIAIKKKFKELTVVLSDLSHEALQVAHDNAQQNGVSIHLQQGDLFAPFDQMKCDFLVCNPPYVSEEEFSQLEPEVKEWEPKLALVSGKTGLEFYDRLARGLKNYLADSGFAWFEMGSGQGNSVCSLFEAQGWKVSLHSDWAGHDRFLQVTGH